MRRTNESGMIALLKAISKQEIVDSANLDILEQFQGYAMYDPDLQEYDPVVFATVMAAQLTDEDIAWWDNNDGDDDKPLYIKKRNELLKSI